MKTKPLLIILSIILTLFVIALVALARIVSSKVYFMREGSGGTLFWKADEAYLFMDGTRRGYHFKYIKYPWIALGEYLNAPPFLNDSRVSDIVIRVTSSAVERHQVDFGEDTGNAARSITPFDDGFYAQCPGWVLCKWTGKSFEPATQDEQQRHDGTNRLYRGAINNGSINGWSMQNIGSSPGDHFEVQVGDKFVIAVKNQATDQSQYHWVSVNLVRPGQVPESLYDVNGTPRTVSKAEYERAFH